MAADQSIHVLTTSKTNATASALTKTITGVTNPGGGVVSLAISTHGYSAGDIIMVWGTTDYNGEHAVVGTPDGDHITITETYTSSQQGSAAKIAAAAGTSDVIFDLSPYVLEFQMTQSITEEVSQMTIKCCLPDDSYYQYIEQGAAVEVWVKDGTSSITFPGTLTDTGDDGDRAFVGFIVSTQYDLSQNDATQTIRVMSYGKALLDTMCEAYYYDSDRDGMMADLVTLLNTTRGANVDDFYGQPGFVGSFPVDATTYDEIWWNRVPFWDAFGELAASLDYALFVNDLTYHPRQAGSATNRPTITIAAYGSATMTWSIVGSTNLMGGTNSRTIDRTKNVLFYHGTDPYGTPVYVKAEQDTTARATGVIGTDVFGELSSYYDDERTRDPTRISSLATTILDKTEHMRRECKLSVFPGRFVAGTRVVGNLVSVNADATLLLGYTSGGAINLQIMEATYNWGMQGLSLSLSVSHYNPAFGRMLCPPTSRTKSQLASELYQDFRIWYAERVDHATYEFAVKSIDPHDPDNPTTEFQWGGSNILEEVGDSNGWMSAWSLTSPNAVDTVRWYWTDSGGEKRVDIYSEDGLTQLATGTTGGTGVVPFVEVAGSGYSGSVTVAAGAAGGDDNDASNRLYKGIDVNDYSNTFCMTYYRNNIYILYADKTSKSHVMKKFARDGTLVDTWSIGTVAIGGSDRLVRSLAVNRGDGQFWFTFESRREIQEAAWSAALSTSYFARGQWSNLSDVEMGVGECATFDYERNLINYGRLYDVVGTASTADHYVVQYGVLTNENADLPLGDVDRLTTDNTIDDPLFYNSTSGVNEYSGWSADFNNGLWFFFAYGAAITKKLYKWMWDGRVLQNYGDLSYTYNPRGVIIIPLRQERTAT